jgi:hypothetical protein
MGASDHLNHKQLKLFMTARELMQHPAGDDTEQWRPMEQNRELFNEKLGEALDFGDEGVRLHQRARGSRTNQLRFCV